MNRYDLTDFEWRVTDLFVRHATREVGGSDGGLDAICGRYRRENVRPGGLKKRPGGWAMKRGNLSVCYTTRLSDLLTVKA